MIQFSKKQICDLSKLVISDIKVDSVKLAKTSKKLRPPMSGANKLSGISYLCQQRIFTCINTEGFFQVKNRFQMSNAVHHYEYLRILSKRQ